eukprot:3015026-Pyramimonas_sp.AAC.1
MIQGKQTSETSNKNDTIHHDDGVDWGQPQSSRITGGLLPGDHAASTEGVEATAGDHLTDIVRAAHGNSNSHSKCRSRVQRAGRAASGQRAPPQLQGPGHVTRDVLAQLLSRASAVSTSARTVPPSGGATAADCQRIQQRDKQYPGNHHGHPSRSHMKRNPAPASWRREPVEFSPRGAWHRSVA